VHWLVGLLAFLVYALTAAPSVAPGHDSAELTTAAYCLGVAHPPGYPLYVRLGHLWGGWLGGDYGWRLNLFSGLGVATAAAGLTWLVQRATAQASAALLAGLGFALLGSVWRQAVVAEVFGLHFALLAVLAVLGWQIAQRCADSRPPGSRLWAFYAVVGLCLAHHHTFVLALPGLLLLAWPHRRPVLLTPAWIMVPLVAGPFYLDMLVRARAEPALNWGGVTHGEALWNHFLRRAYGTFKLTAQVDPVEHGVAHGLAYFLFTYVRQAPWPWMLLATWGGLVGRRVEPRLWALGWGWLLAFGPFFALIGRQRLDDFHLDLLERFYASSYLGLALLAGLGAASLKGRLGRGGSWLLPVLLLTWQGYSNLPQCRLDGRELAASYAHRVLQSCPSGAVLLTYGDLPVGVIQYAQVVEGYRPDVLALSQGLLRSPWYRRRLPAEVEDWLRAGDDELSWARAAQADGRAVLFTQYRPLAGQWRPRALCWQWYPRARGGQFEVESSCLTAVLEDAARLRPGLRGEGRFWPRYLISARISSLRQLAGALFQPEPARALAAMDAVLALGGDRPTDYLNRGLLQQRLGQHAAALRDFARCLELDSNVQLAGQAALYSQVYLEVAGPAAALGSYCASP
jgi:tetratricopeptide (TPR) repeat protein